ncbi:carboxypeptidase-like regulatory domain-containing protein [Parachryseolinea silvisoli]|uniref:carboxypeptidase-like regulatory domain-containing protein n=1 Tax=Parachryseolinea silvisoli TaxID=2873601 RepID=UPI002265F65B|nr:carboxypeptidase-like regulatory domain-containing protein [Parachryseolinea silvisoli]MCD9018952.1 carboxypeptidase regulatory-like domain-containing protein [Parachryseolinea silvisoli]
MKSLPVLMLSCFLALFATLPGRAQSPLRIQVQVAKPYPNKINDFQSNPNQVVIVITNASRVSYDIQLLGSVTGDNNIAVRTAAGYRSARPITVAPMGMTRVTAEEVGELFNPNHLVFAGITREAAIRMNGLPEGIYQVCAHAIDYTTRTPLSEEEPLGCSNLFMVSNLEPPVIIRPFADDSLRAYSPQNMVFSWSLPPGAPPTTQYTVRLVEVPDMHRNPFDVMRSSRQPYYETTVTGAPTLLYGPAEPPLTPGRRYALMVTAIDPFTNVVFRNGGRSEVVAFTYGTPARRNTTGSTLVRATTTIPLAIPRTTIKGKINWYFKATEEKQSPLVSAVVVNHFVETSLINAMLDPSAGTSSTTQLNQVMHMTAITNAPVTPTTPANTPQQNTTYRPTQPLVATPRSTISNAQAAAVGIYGGGTVNTVTSTPLSAAASLVDRVADLVEIGNNPYPLQRVPVKVYAVHPSGGESLLTSTVTDGEGVFNVSFINTAFYNPALGDKIKVYINHPDFLLQRNVLSLPRPDSVGHFDLGTLSALARTFRFKPHVVDEEGQPVSAAVVEVYRPSSYYWQEPNHRKEGNGGGDGALVNGQLCTKVASIRSGSAGPRLFYSDDPLDRYIVKVVHSKLYPLVTTLQVTADGSARESILTIEKTFTANTRMPTLKGQVAKRLQPVVDVKGAIVTVYFNDDAVFGKNPGNTVESLGNHLLQGTVMSALPKPASNLQTTQPVNSVSAKSESGIKVAGNANLLAPASTTSSTIALQSYVGSTATSVAAATQLGKSRSTTTDSSGNFLFTELPISQTPTRITIRIPGSERVYEYTALINVKGQEIDMGKILLDMKVLTLAGVVKDEQQQPVARPVLRWASGGSPFEGDAQGRFVTTNTEGTDTLVITKLGFETKRVPVKLTETTASTGNSSQPSASAVIQSVGQWPRVVTQLPSLVPVTAQAPAFTSQGLGLYAVHTANLPLTSPTEKKGSSKKKVNAANAMIQADLAFAPLYSSLFTAEQIPSNAVDLGTIIVRKKIGRLRVKVVKDADKTPVLGARITIVDTPLTGQTDAQGTWYSEVPGGDIVVEVSGPAGSALVTTQKQVTPHDTEVTVLEVALKSGVTIRGTVTAAGQPVGEAAVRVDGFDYLHATTATNGHYTLVVPAGDYTLQVTKTGYVGAEKQQTFSGTQATVDFVLTRPSFDISTLLGFPVEIERLEGTGNTRTLSGAFINLPGNALFQVKPGMRIPFDDVVMSIAGGVAVPQGGQVNLSVTSLEAKAFGYLPVRIKNGEAALAIRQVPGQPTQGQLVGIPEIDYGKFMPIPLGLTLPAGAKHTLGTTPTVILQSGNALPVPDALDISFASGQSVELYAFACTLGTPGCQVKADGLHLQGELSLSGVPLLNNSKFKIRELLIGTDGSVRTVTADIGDGLNFSLAGWAAGIQALSINENGLKLTGDLTVRVPASTPSKIGFNNLTISKTALYGGDFSLPAAGLDIFGIVQMKPGSRPLSFGRIGNTSVHFIGGSGEFRLPKFIDKTLSVEFFQIQTDGNFQAVVPTNFNVPLLGVADISVRSIGFNTKGSIGIDVMGDFNLHAIPFFQASVGGVHFGPNGSVSIDELGVGFDLVGIARLNARARFIDQPERKGFEGSGNIKLTGLPLELGLGFKYYKLPNGIEVGGLLRAGVMIPVGAVTITQVEGEFSLNTQDKKWMGRLGGAVSIGGMNAVLAIKPLSITVENGPVFKLDGGLAVLDQTIATAHGILDFPRSYFSFTFEQNLDFLPELFTVGGGGAFVVSTAQNNTYWLMGVHYHASMLGGLVRGNANITAGWGMNVDAHPEHRDYTSFIDRNYLDNGALKGIHVATYAGINFDTGERGFAGVASGRAWYNNYGAVNLDMGFGRGRYGFRVAAGWEAGAYLKIADINIAGLEAGINGELKGFYDYPARYLSFEGSLRAKLIAWIGACDQQCSNKICWGGCFNACIFGCELCPIPVGGKLCLRPGVNARYNSADGFGLSIDF